MTVKDILLSPVGFVALSSWNGRERRQRPRPEHRGENGEGTWDDDTTPIRPPRPPGPETGLRLWHLLVGQITLFSMMLGAHYVLVQRTLGEEFAKQRMEIALVQAKTDSTVSSLTTSGALRETRLTQVELRMNELEKEIALMRERQAVVRQKLGLNGSESPR